MNAERLNQKIKIAIRKFKWSLEIRGTRGTIVSLVRRATGKRVIEPHFIHPFDQEFGVDTSGRISGADLGVGHEHDLYNNAYLGVPPSRFRAAIARWKAEAKIASLEQHVMLDIGCGKGRALLLASEMGFRQVVGVELNGDLARVARANIALWNAAGRTRCTIEVIEGDAVEVLIPEGRLLIYLFNSFREPVLRRLLQRIEQMAENRRNDIDLIYLVPEHEEVVEEESRFRRIWRGMIPMSNEEKLMDPAAVEDLCTIYRR
jgi:SAM-dependent methyltransferase